MSFRKRVVFGLILALVACSATFSASLAASSHVSGTVAGRDGSPIAGATVSVVDPATGVAVASSTTDASGSYAATVPDGVYNVQVTPPSGSAFGPLVSLNETVSGDTSLMLVLAPANPVAVSGMVADGAGSPLVDQHLQLYNSTSFAATTTDSHGSYTFEVVPGSYTIAFYGDFDSNASLPQAYYLYTTSPLDVTQDTTLELTFPTLSRVTVRVEDPSGNPRPNVAVASSQPLVTGLAFGGLPAKGYSSAGGETDATGAVTLALFPTSPGTSYSFTTTPPADSDVLPTTTTDVSVAGQTAEFTVILTAPAPTVTDTAVVPPPATGSPTSGPPAPTPSVTPSATAIPTSTPTSAPTPATPAPSGGPATTPTPTSPPAPPPSRTSTPVSTPTRTVAPPATSTPKSSLTPVPSATSVPTATVPPTAAAPPTSTRQPSPTAVPTESPESHATATPCATINCRAPERDRPSDPRQDGNRPVGRGATAAHPSDRPGGRATPHPPGGGHPPPGTTDVHHDADLSGTGSEAGGPGRGASSGSGGKGHDGHGRDDRGSHRREEG
jgi:Carboxypeptidase regulatory-like domain